MKVLKFGGTSVRSAERMKEVARLISNSESQIVVLSAMSGTTNALVQIAEALYSKKNSKANQLIIQLEKKYKQVLTELYSDPIISKEASALIDSHFSYIKSFTQDLFTIHEEKAILAQGELIATALFHLHSDAARRDVYFSLPVPQDRKPGRYEYRLIAIDETGNVRIWPGAYMVGSK